MNQEGGAQNHNEYFYGEGSDKDSVIVDPELLVVPENPEDLKLKIQLVKSEIELAQENENKHQSIKNNHLYKIEEEALTPEVKNAGKIVEILQKQKNILEDKVLQSKPKTSFRKKLASFLSIFS